MSTYVERRAARHARIAEMIAAKKAAQMVCAAPPAPTVEPAPPVIVREFSAAGPCLTTGKLVRETANFYIYLEWKGGDRYGTEEKRISKKRPGHYSAAHTEPCPSCRDHAHTQYPNGYQD